MKVENHTSVFSPVPRKNVRRAVIERVNFSVLLYSDRQINFTSEINVYRVQNKLSGVWEILFCECQKIFFLANDKIELGIPCFRPA